MSHFISQRATFPLTTKSQPLGCNDENNITILRNSTIKAYSKVGVHPPGPMLCIRKRGLPLHVFVPKFHLAELPNSLTTVPNWRQPHVAKRRDADHRGAQLSLHSACGGCWLWNGRLVRHLCRPWAPFFTRSAQI